MKISRVLFLLVLAVAASLAATHAQGARADQPVFQVVNVDETRVAPGLTRNCHFTVMRHDYGTITTSLFYRNGRQVREIDRYNLTTTFSANGRTATGRTRGIDMYKYNEDGSYTVMAAGPGDLIVVPGQGFVLGFVGNVLFDVDANGNETEVREAGNNNITPEGFAAVCAALAP